MFTGCSELLNVYQDEQLSSHLDSLVLSYALFQVEHLLLLSCWWPLWVVTNMSLPLYFMLVLMERCIDHCTQVPAWHYLKAAMVS
jgi:hypothetical protein